MGRNQISSFACNTIKTSSNDDKWRQQRGVSQPRQSASSAAAAANLLRSLTKKLIIKKNLKWNFLAAIWHNNHRDTPGESACRMKLKISWIWIHSVDVKPLPPPPPPPLNPPIITYFYTLQFQEKFGFCGPNWSQRLISVFPDYII